MRTAHFRLVFLAALAVTHPAWAGCEKGPVSIEDSGVAGDGVTDDTRAISQFLAGMKAGCIVYLGAGRRYLIKSADLIIPPNIILAGAASPLAPVGAADQSRSSGFLLQPSVTIKMGPGAQLRDLIVERSDLNANPTAPQAMNAVAQWGKDQSVGITIPANTGGVILTDVKLLGFHTGVRALSGTFSFQHIWGDTFNGIEVANAGDNYLIDDARFEPFYSLGTPSSSGSWARPGVAFILRNGSTGGILTRLFSFMYASGLLLEGAGVTQVANSGFEWQPSAGNGISNTVGARWINHNAQTSLSNVYFNGFDTSASDEGLGEVIMNSPSSVGARKAAFYLGGAIAAAANIELEGKPPVGTVIQITLTSSSLDRDLLTVSSRVESDGLKQVAAQLAQAINLSQPAIAAKVSAAASGRNVTVRWPEGTKLTVSAQIQPETVAAQVAVHHDKPQPGSYGAIFSANVQGNRGPSFVVGSSAGRWLISSPFLSNGPLPQEWLSIPASSVSSVVLSGVMWSANSDANISDCGRSPHLAKGSTDAAGTISEGEGAISCRLTFKTPYPFGPNCVVTSNEPVIGFSYSVTSTSIEIRHRQDEKGRYSYLCNP